MDYYKQEVERSSNFGDLFYCNNPDFLMWIYSVDEKYFREYFDIFTINKGNMRELKRIFRESFPYDIYPLFDNTSYKISFNNHRLLDEKFHSRDEMINRYFYNVTGNELFDQFMKDNLRNIENYETTFFDFFSEHEYLPKSRLPETEHFIQILNEKSKDKETFCKNYDLTDDKYKSFREEFDKFIARPLFVSPIEAAKNKIPMSLDQIMKVSMSFLDKFGGTITGGAALAFYTEKFIPNDVDVYFTDEEKFEKAKTTLMVKGTSRTINHYNFTEIQDVQFCEYRGVEFNLILVKDLDECIKNFDMECCRLIWDPSLRDDFFARSNPIDRFAVDKNRITFPLQMVHRSNVYFRERIKKYMLRGMNIIVVDNPKFDNFKNRIIERTKVVNERSVE